MIPLQRQGLIESFLATNSQINLSAIRDADGVYHKHILDSLALVDHDIIQPGMKIADVGTGWGFPLMPLAVTYPETQFVGIETRKKKVNAVNDLLQHNNITNAHCVWTRVQDHREVYDIVMARAVAYSDKLIPMLAPLRKKKTWLLVLYKQVSDHEETDMVHEARHYGLSLKAKYPYTLPHDTTHRALYVLGETKRG